MASPLSLDEPSPKVAPPKRDFKITVRPPDDLRLDFFSGFGVPMTPTSVVPMMSGQSVHVTQTGFGISALWRKKGKGSAAGLRLGISNSRFTIDETKLKDFPAFGEIMRRMQDSDDMERAPTEGREDVEGKIEDIGEEEVGSSVSISYLTLPIGFIWYHEGIQFLEMGKPGSTISLNLFETNLGAYGLFAWGDIKRGLEIARFKGAGAGGNLAVGISTSWSDYTLGIDAALNLEYLAGENGALVFTIDGGLYTYLQIKLRDPR